MTIEELIKKLEKKKEEYIKLRNKYSKGWQYNNYYYYQGRIEQIDDIIDYVKQHR